MVVTMDNSIIRPTRFRWVIKDKLAGSAKIFSDAELKWLQTQGIKCIVSLTEDPLVFDWKTYPFERYHLPIVDFTAPTLDEMHDYVQYVDRMLAQNNPVLTHCMAGLGRTGAMLAVYLVSTCKEPEEAIGGIFWNYENRYVRTDSLCHGLNAYAGILDELEDGLLLSIPEPPFKMVLNKLKN